MVQDVDPYPDFIRIYSTGDALNSFSGLKIINNSFIDSRPSHAGLGQLIGFGFGNGSVAGSGNEIRNNLFLGTPNGMGINKDTGGGSFAPVWSNNIYPYMMSMDPSGVVGIPSLDANFIPLPSDTLARDLGVNMGSNFTTDKLGTIRPQGSAWDIGAFEYVSGPADTTPPAVSLTAPAQGATVSGNTTVSATASDDTAVVGVQFKLDGANLGSEDTTSPYSITWDTTQSTNGSHTLSAVARDAAGNQTTATSRTVTVSNAPTPPSITTHPQSTTVSVGSTATFSVTGAGTPPLTYQWQKNSTNISGATASSYTTPTLLLADSGNTYRAVVTNSAGNVTSNSATLTVTNTETIWGTRTSSTFNSDNQPWDLGMIFTPTTNGQALGARVYGAPNESGTHSVRLWRNSDNTLLAGPFSFTYAGSGWKEYTFPSPVSLTANQPYTISVSTGSDTAGWYTAIANDLTSGGTNGLHLSYPANAAVYSTTIGTRPTQSYNSENYLRDILFAPSGGGDTTAPNAPTGLAVQ